MTRRVRASRRAQLARRLRVLVIVFMITATVAPASAVATVLAASEEDSAESRPRLLFGGAELGDMRESIRSGVLADAATSLRRQVDGYTNRTSPSYVDPTLVDNPLDPDDPDYRYLDGPLGQSQSGTYLTELAFAYLLFNEERYGEHAIDLLLALSNRWPAWNDNELGRGDMTKGIGLAFDWTYGLMAPEERDLIVDRLVAELPALNPSTGRTRNGVYEGDKLFSCLDGDWRNNRQQRAHNWMGVCGGGNGLTLLAIEGEPGVPDLDPWLVEAKDMVLRHFQRTYGSGGDGAEGHLYAAYGLQNSLPFAFAWERMRGEDLVAQAPGLANVPEWLAYEQIPGKGTQWVPRNDSIMPGKRWFEVIPMFIAARGDRLSGWLFDHTIGPEGDDLFGHAADPITGQYPGCGSADGNLAMWALDPCYLAPEVFTILYYQAPDELPRVQPDTVLSPARHYPERGLVDMRTGWATAADEMVATFEAKHDHTADLGHYQNDIGSFTLYGHGANFALDSGYGHNYSCNEVSAPLDNCDKPGAMADTGRAIGHNVVIVDDDPETQYRFGPATSHETVTEFVDGRHLSVVRSDLRSAYAADPSTVPWAERDLVLSRAGDEPLVLAVADRIRRDGAAHGYRWQVHTDAANAVAVTGNTFTVAAPSGAVMTGGVSDAHTSRLLTTAPFQARTADLAAPVPLHTVIRSETAGAMQQDMDHLAVMAVTAPGEMPASVTPLACAGCSLASITWDGGEMLVASVAHEASTIASEQLASDGRLAKLTVDRGETTLAEGTSLVADGRSYVEVAGGPSTVTVSGDRVSATGEPANTYRVFAPQPLTEVTVNGAAVDYVRDGDYVSFPRPDFALTLSPTSLEAPKNSDVSAEATLSSVFGFDDSVSLSVEDLPADVAVSFEPSDVVQVSPGEPAVATVTLRAGPRVRPGTYPFRLVGVGDGLRRSVNGLFVVLDDDG